MRPVSLRDVPLIALLAALGAAGPTSHAGSIRPAGPAEIVIYNDDRALVREPRTLDLERGRNEVRVGGVPARIDSTSVRLEGEGIALVSQSFRYDLWNGPRLFRRFLGDSITYRQGTRAYRGLLAGIDGDELYILRKDSVGVLTVLRRSQLTEVEFPRGIEFATRPELVWRLDAASRGPRVATLSYLTAGVTWRGEYAAVLDQSEQSVELSGWATIGNQCGASFEKARVSLVAGELHREGETPDRGAAGEGSEAGAAASRAADLFAYHIYSLPERVDLKHLETVQVALFQPARLAARRGYVYDGARDGSKVRVRVDLANEKGAGLGMPLPAGRVRVYARDPSGATTLVGEDAVGHTPAGERVRLLAGIAFDLVGERVRVSHTRVSRAVTEDRYEITLRNRGAKPAQVTVVENLYGNWEISAKTTDFRRRDAETVEFDVSVPAGGESKLDYTARYTF